MFVADLKIGVFDLPAELENHATYQQNNEMQTRAIRSAMTQRLTVVQGPPGAYVSVFNCKGLICSLSPALLINMNCT